MLEIDGVECSHKVVIDGMVFTIGDEERCRESAARLEHLGMFPPEDIDIVRLEVQAA